MKTSPLGFAVVLALMLLCGCGSSTGTAITDAGFLQSDWMIVDLQTGSTEPRATIDASDPAYRDRLMAFRRIPAGTFKPGVLGAYIGDLDEKNRSTVTVTETWLGMFEVTRAQWARLAGTTAPTADGDLPATVTRGEAEGMLTRQSTAGRKYDLPDADAWEWAAGAGSGNSFAWGTSLIDTDAAPYAVFDPHVTSTLPVPTGPAVVGSKRPNDWGIFDMQGNLWEHVRSSIAGYEARGGSWAHPLITARAANRLSIPYDVPHPLIGIRLAWSE